MVRIGSHLFDLHTGFTFHLKRFDLFKEVHQVHINCLRLLLRDSGDKQRLQGARDGDGTLSYSYSLFESKEEGGSAMNGRGCAGSVFCVADYLCCMHYEIM